MIKHGAKLTGHVTQAQARASGAADSQLGIIFDKAVLKGGETVNLAAAIQALAPPATANLDTGMSGGGGMAGGGSMPAPSGGGSSGGGLVGGATGTVNNTVGAAGGAVGSATRGVGDVAGNAAGSLNSTTKGVVGIPGLQLSNELSNTTNGTVLVSKDKSVHLDSGTQMVLRVAGQ